MKEMSSIMSATPIRIGIVGCGKIATCSHIPAFKACAGTRITALFDVDAAKAEAARSSLVPDAEVFSDYDRLLQSGLVDAVTICTPNDTHRPLTLAALGAGLHVLCEKPMAATLPEATEMIEAARAAGRILQINQSCRYSPLYAKVAELVHSGAIGEPRHARCIRAGGSTPDMGWSPGATWFVQKAHQGGLVLDIGIHMADMLRWVVGEVDEVAAYVDTWKPDIDVPDNVSALFRFRNGATGVLELSWTLPVGAGLLEVYGTAGTLRVGFGGAAIELLKREEGKTVTTAVEPATGLPTSFTGFLAAIRGEGESITPGEYGRRALALCDAIMRSSESGQFVKVEHF